MRGVRGLVALLGLMNVAPVLAWTAGLGSFRTWFLVASLPSLLLLVAIAVVASRGGLVVPHDAFCFGIAYPARALGRRCPRRTRCA